MSLVCRSTLYCRYVIRRSGLNRALPVEKFDNVSSLKWHASSGGSTQNLTREYFSQLPMRLFKKLKKRYLGDFLAFGYDPELYNPQRLKKLH